MNRLLDVIISFILLIVLLPVFSMLITIIFFTMGRPVFFAQQRTGLHGKPFKIIKLRTMTNNFNNNDDSMEFTDYVTPFGKFLRSTSLDELPELWNVLKGEMSLVGPRPLMVEYLPLYNTRQARRHDVKPGITGWAQIKGRNAITWEEKFELDFWYIENKSLFLDLKILIITIINVIIRKNINISKNLNMPRFTGS